FLADKHVFLSVSNFEGTSIAMLEAMGNGLVPVVTDVSGVRDVIDPGTNGWIAPVGDIPGLAGRVADLARDPGVLARAGGAAWEAVRSRYSLEASARALADVLHAAAARPRGSLRLTRAHPAQGVFDLRWLPNPLTITLRRMAKRVFGRPS